MTDSLKKREFIDQLVTEYGSSLERFLQRKLANAADAAEIAQEAYLRIYRLNTPNSWITPGHSCSRWHPTWRLTSCDGAPCTTGS